MDQPSNTANHDSGRELSTSRVLHFTPQQVYRALTTPELLARWWGPAGFTNTFEECDLRPGGSWRLTMHGPDGVDYPNLAEFVELAPQRVVIRHIAPVHHFVLTITLVEHDAATRVGWHMCFDSAQELAAVRDVVVVANEQNLDRLAAVLADSRQ